MKNIPARIGWELILPIFLIILLPISLDVKNGNWEIVIVHAGIFGVIILLMLTIRYKIDAEFSISKIQFSELQKLK